ncbi:MAG: BofC C-terminal domain-containing protein [Firmicutes bacterium]|nr:BofC C-terminal domain-containing protein [Bacillota bacterium]
MNSRRRFQALLLVGLVLALASFAITYFSFVYLHPVEKSEPKLLPRLFPFSEGSGEDLTRSGAVVVRKVFYAKSKLEVEERGTLPTELVGLTRAELAIHLKNGIIERFTPSEIVIREVRNELAPLHASRRFLGIDGGYVAVFRGVPGLAYEVAETTDIPVNMLPPQEVSDLQKGITVYNDKNLMEVLMSLSSLAFAD